jgi:hypothetical protein
MTHNCKNCSSTVIISDSGIFVYCPDCDRYNYTKCRNCNNSTTFDRHKRIYCETCDILSPVYEHIINDEPEFFIKTSQIINSNSNNRYGFIDIFVILIIICLVLALYKCTVFIVRRGIV